MGEDVANDQLGIAVADLLQSNKSAATYQRRGVFAEPVLVRITHDEAHAGQRGQFFRSALRIATRDQDFRPGILAMNAADGGASILIGGGRDATCVKDDDFGLHHSTGALQAAVEQLALDSRAVGLGRAAPEILHMIGRHKTIILATNRLRPRCKSAAATRHGEFAS